MNRCKQLLPLSYTDCSKPVTTIRLKLIKNVIDTVTTTATTVTTTTTRNCMANIIKYAYAVLYLGSPGHTSPTLYLDYRVLTYLGSPGVCTWITVSMYLGSPGWWADGRLGARRVFLRLQQFCTRSESSNYILNAYDNNKLLQYWQWEAASLLPPSE